MKVKNMIAQLENLYGRQPQEYLLRLINDALLDMSAKIQHHTKSSKHKLESYQRSYPLGDEILDIIRVEIKDTNDRYVRIPKLTDPHKLLKDDTDDSVDSLT